ncbi:MAG: PAS domain-containing protein, partial [Planctomycetota bacterium]
MAAEDKTPCDPQEEIETLRRQVAELSAADDRRRQAEAACRAVFEQLGDAVFIADTDTGTIVDCNRRAEALLGRSRDEIVGLHQTQLHPPEQEERRRRNFREHVENDGILMQSEVITSDGRIVPVSVSASVITLGGKRRMLGVFRDATEGKRAEAALLAQKETAQRYLDVAGVMLITIDAQGKVTLANRKACEVLGYEQDDVVGRDWFAHLLPERLRKDVRGVFDQLMAGDIEPVEYFENPVLTHSGEERIIAWHNTMLRDDSGCIVGTLSSGEDITERRHAEEDLRKSEQRFRSLVEHTTDSVFCYEYDPPIPTELPTEEQVRLLYGGVLAECNDVCAKSYGFAKAKEVLGKGLTELFGTGPGGLDGFFAAFIENGYRTVDAEAEEALADGSTRHFLNNGHGVIEDGALVRVWGTYRDITERKRAEEALRESEKRYRALFDNSLELVYIHDLEGRFLDANEAALDALGVKRSDIGDTTFADLVEDEGELAKAIEATKEIVATGVQRAPAVYRLRTARGDRLWVEAVGSLVYRDGKPHAIHGVARDITERKQAEERLQTIVSRSPIPTAVGGSDGSIMSMNEAMEELTGHESGQFRDVTDWMKKLYPDPEYQTFVWRNIQQALDGKPQDCTEFTITRKDGQKRVASFETAFFEGGLIIQVIDITDRKRAEDALKTSEEKYRTVVENASDGITIVSGGKVVFVNRQSA